MCPKTNFSVISINGATNSFGGDEFVSRQRFYFRGDKFAVDRFIFRATIVYQATKHFQGNEYDSEESGWRADDLVVKECDNEVWFS